MEYVAPLRREPLLIVRMVMEPLPEFSWATIKSCCLGRVANKMIAMANAATGNAMASVCLGDKH